MRTVSVSAGFDLESLGRRATWWMKIDGSSRLLVDKSSLEFNWLDNFQQKIQFSSSHNHCRWPFIGYHNQTSYRSMDKAKPKFVHNLHSKHPKLPFDWLIRRFVSSISFFFFFFFIKFLNFFRYASNFQFIWESNIRSTSSSFLRFSFEIHNENFFFIFFFLFFGCYFHLATITAANFWSISDIFVTIFGVFWGGFACFTSETKSNQQMECGMEAIWSIFAHVQLRLVLFQPDTVWWICCGYWRWHLMSIRHWRETVVMDWWDAFGVWGGWWRRRCIWSGYCCRCGLMNWMHVVVLNDSGQIAKFWNWNGICENWNGIAPLRLWWR